MKKIAYLLMAATMVACSGKKQEMPAASNDFAVVTLVSDTAELTTSYPTTLKGVEDIEIRPRVAGQITKVLVDEGDFVRKGQVLFQIDAVQYAAAVKAAEAQINVINANIATSELTLKNKQMLREQDIISQYDFEVAQNQLKTLQAQLAQAQSQLVNAKENLSYCTVKSPVAGVVGMIPYRLGSLVSGQSVQPLTTVSNISEMYAYFSMPEKELLKITKEGGVDKAIGEMPLIDLKMADGSIYDIKGKVSAITGVIDASTGSVQMRATFANTGNILRSGGTGTVIFPSYNTNIIKVAQKATFDIQNKKFITVTCCDCGYTELYKQPENAGMNVLDFLFGNG
jgi:membrane fusion protein (multidrug efflux system)